VNLEIQKNANLEPAQIEKLRLAVGWNPLDGKYQTALENSFAHYSILEQQDLIAFTRVISDGTIYALIVDVMVHPAFQAKGLGQKLLEFVLEDLKLEGIRSVNVIFDARLEKFYAALGFEMLMGAILRIQTY
jgi:aralkylamine N-acetyltransferase